MCNCCAEASPRIGLVEPFKFGHHVPDSPIEGLPLKALAGVLVSAAKSVYFGELAGCAGH